MPDDRNDKPRQDPDIQQQTEPAKERGERPASSELIAGKARKPESEAGEAGHSGEESGQDRRPRE